MLTPHIRLVITIRTMPNHLKLNENHWIDKDALDICKNLSEAGHTAYLVGGSVRDYLAGVPPKDFDIATDALPNQVKKLISRAYVIGKRFRLVLVHRHNVQYEVATFRRNPTHAEADDEEVQNDNLFGEPEQDAKRRDFTINAMFYDPKTKQVIDYVDGLKDIDARVLRMIGDPVERILEDPIRILRALRLSHKLHFQIEENLRMGIANHHACLAEAALPRIREDLLKILRLPAPERCLLECHDLGVMKTCFPLLQSIYMDQEQSEIFETSMHRAVHFIEDYSDPKEQFLCFTYAILKALSANTDKEIWDDELFDSIENSLKNEFGVFKSEVEFIRKNMQLISSFSRIENFIKRGRRRQTNFLSHEAFPYALKLAHWDYYIDSETYLNWQDLYRRDIPHMVEKDIEKMKKLTIDLIV